MRPLTFQEASMLTLLAQARGRTELVGPGDADALLEALPKDLQPLGEYFLNLRQDLPTVDLGDVAATLLKQ